MLRNGEHYKDPTMSSAVKVTDKPTYSSKPAFIQSETPPPPPVFVSRTKALPISEMDLEDLKPLLKGCHKSGGDPEACVRCNGGCAFGTRAVELLNQHKKERENIMTGREKGAQAVHAKAMLEYQEAINSGDMIKWVIDHMNHRTEQDESSIRNMARTKIRLWRKRYGGLIKETPEAAASMDHKPVERKVYKPAPIPVEETTQESEPHLMQMPCLSKKVAAEKAAEGRVMVEIGTTVPPLPEKPAKAHSEVVADLFLSKLTELRNQVSELQSQISAIEGAASLPAVTV